MSKIKHVLPIAAAAIVLTAGSIASPKMLQAESVAASAPSVDAATTANKAAPVAKATVDPDPAEQQGWPRGAATPEKLLQLLGERIVAKDIDGIIALHEPEAAIVNWDGSVIRGRAAIRTFYVDWFKQDPVLKVNPQQTVIAGGTRGILDKEVRNRTAAIMGDYSLEQTAADGTRESFTGNFCDTVQEQPNGTWLYVQDNPYPPHGGPGQNGGSVQKRGAHH